MAIQSFFSDDEQKIANLINDWLATKNNITVKDIKFNTIYINRPSVEDSGIMIYAWVMYE
jgi:hypothetical protein